MDKILITGSAGFVGSNLIRHIIYNIKDVSVIGIDKLSSISDIHNVYMNKASEFYLANLEDKAILDNIFNIIKPNIVIHLAKDNDYISNLKMIENISDLCIKYTSKLVYVSTTDVYKRTINVIDKKINETNQTEAFNKYIAGVIACENLIQAQLQAGLVYNIIRTTEIFGPRCKTGSITDMFLDIKGHGKISLYNKGNNILDVIHIEDFNNAILSILKNGKNNEIYNVSSNIDFLELEVAAHMAETLEEGKINLLEESVANNYINLDCKKLRDLGWTTTKKFKARLKETINWYVNNCQWFFK